MHNQLPVELLFSSPDVFKRKLDSHLLVSCVYTQKEKNLRFPRCFHIAGESANDLYVSRGSGAYTKILQ